MALQQLSVRLTRAFHKISTHCIYSLLWRLNFINYFPGHKHLTLSFELWNITEYAFILRSSYEHYYKIKCRSIVPTTTSNIIFFLWGKCVFEQPNNKIYKFITRRTDVSKLGLDYLYPYRCSRFIRLIKLLHASKISPPLSIHAFHTSTLMKFLCFPFLYFSTASQARLVPKSFWELLQHQLEVLNID